MTTEEETQLLELSVHFGVVGYGRIRDITQLLDYAKKFTDLKIFFDKRSIVPLFIVDRRPKKTNSAGENKT